jgi:thiamine-monophosphate kinase
MRLAEIGEDRFLARLRERMPKPGPRVKLGIGDDAAALALPDGELALLSTDILVENVHYTRQTLPPRYIGRKAVAVNASDIAAMGGCPVGLVVSICVPSETEVEELLTVFDGIIERTAELEIDFVGGNLSQSAGPMTVDVNILGATHGSRMLTRRGARPNDSIYVSGKLGAAAEGLDLLNEGMAVSASGAVLVPQHLREGPGPLAEACLQAHMDPEPRLELGRFLNERNVASSCIDLSDGLSRDLHRICAESDVGARLDETALPIHPGVLAWERVRRRPALERALAGGEDYELLFTSSDDQMLREWQGERGEIVTRIGVATDPDEGIQLHLRDGTKRVLSSVGWDHFTGERAPGGR